LQSEASFETIGLLERETLKDFGLEQGDYLIDVGCGSGRLALPLSEYLQDRYLGIDIMPELIAYARKLVQRPGWRFKVIEGIGIPEADGRADMVCFFSVFTHLLHEQSYIEGNIGDVGGSNHLNMFSVKMRLLPGLSNLA
jgi:ubiquinone/menaquinone biosynthesis C-methylase UbiE